jgi:hypothetical protein
MRTIDVSSLNKADYDILRIPQVSCIRLFSLPFGQFFSLILLALAGHDRR